MDTIKRQFVKLVYSSGDTWVPTKDDYLINVCVLGWLYRAPLMVAQLRWKQRSRNYKKYGANNKTKLTVMWEYCSPTQVSGMFYH